MHLPYEIRQLIWKQLVIANRKDRYLLAKDKMQQCLSPRKKMRVMYAGFAHRQIDEILRIAVRMFTHCGLSLNSITQANLHPCTPYEVETYKRQLKEAQQWPGESHKRNKSELLQAYTRGAQVRSFFHFTIDFDL